MGSLISTLLGNKRMNQFSSDFEKIMLVQPSDKLACLCMLLTTNMNVKYYNEFKTFIKS